METNATPRDFSWDQTFLTARLWVEASVLQPLSRESEERAQGNVGSIPPFGR